MKLSNWTVLPARVLTDPCGFVDQIKKSLYEKR